MDAWIDWARGPGFRLAAALCVLGLVRYVLVAAIWMRQVYRQAGDKNIPWQAVWQATFSWFFPLSHLRHRTTFSVSSIVFHVGVILAPLLLASHLELIEQSIGVSWPPLPTLVVDVLTIMAIVGLTFIFAYRLATRSGLALSRFHDYSIIALVAIPFITGFLAMHPALNPFGHQTTMLVHILSADLLLALIPFTKLAHVALQPATQLISELGWHFPQDGGERVARALGKENQPI